MPMLLQTNAPGQARAAAPWRTQLAVAAGAILWCALEAWALLRARTSERFGLGDDA